MHAAIDFASFGADGDAPDVDAIAEEAGGAAKLTAGGDMVQVELQTKAGVATISVPPAALNGSSLDASAVSLDAFLDALVAGALSKYDTDQNGSIEMDEFVAFASENPFLSTWFGHLTDSSSGKSSWKDDFTVS